MAVLELLAGTAWAWIVTSHLLLHMYRHLALRLTAVCHEVCAGCSHVVHVISSWLLWSRSLCLRCVPERRSILIIKYFMEMQF